MQNQTALEAKTKLLEAVRSLLSSKPCKLRIADVCPTLAPDEVGLTKAEAYEIYTLIANLDQDWDKTNTIAGRQRAWNKPDTEGKIGGGKGGNRGKWSNDRKALNFVAKEFSSTGNLDLATKATLGGYAKFQGTPLTFKWLVENYTTVMDHIKEQKLKK